METSAFGHSVLGRCMAIMPLSDMVHNDAIYSFVIDILLGIMRLEIRVLDRHKRV